MAEVRSSGGGRANLPPSPVRSLAVCVAHPDDEGYAVYGSVALHRFDENLRLIVLHATDGEAGQVAPGLSTAAGGLGQWRRDEDRRGWAAVGKVPDRHEWWGYPDGHLDAVPFDELVQRAYQVLVEERPDVVLTFGPDGVTGHPDHIAIGLAITAAFHRARRRPGPGLHRLLHGGIRLSRFERGQRWMARRGLDPWDPTRVYHLRGTPDHLIGVDVDARSVAHLVVAGLKEHRSQRHVLFDPEGTDESWRRVCSFESHVVAWPARRPVPVLTDIFEGLPEPGPAYSPVPGQRAQSTGSRRPDATSNRKPATARPGR